MIEKKYTYTYEGVYPLSSGFYGGQNYIKLWNSKKEVLIYLWMYCGDYKINPQDYKIKSFKVDRQ